MTGLARIPEPEYMDIEEEAAAYAEADFDEVNEAFVDRLLELMPRTGFVHALDLGTGPCDIPMRVLARRPAWRIAAVDASFAMLQFGRRRLAQAPAPKPALDTVLLDAKRLPFRDHSFGLVFTNSILHHITEATPFWQEIKRVSASGATVFLRDLMRPDTEVQARAIVTIYSGNESALLQEEFYRSLLSAYTVEEVQMQLREAGLDTLSVEPVTDRHLDVTGTLKC